MANAGTKKQRQAEKDSVLDFRIAAERIPEMIAKEMNQKQNSARAKPLQPADTQQSRLWLLWLGVGTISVVMFVFWFFSVQSLFFDASLQRQKQPSILGSAKEDLTSLLNAAGAGENNSLASKLQKIGQRNEAKDALKTALGTIPKVIEPEKQTFTATTTSSTTPETEPTQ